VPKKPVKKRPDERDARIDALVEQLEERDARIEHLVEQLAAATQRAEKAESFARSASSALGGGPVKVTIREAKPKQPRGIIPVRGPRVRIRDKATGEVLQDDKAREADTGFAPEV
jgi:hypothetical protein